MSKYHAQPQMVDGVRFASKKEARRYGELRLLEKAGEVTELQLQPKFPITMNGEVVCIYIADFRYRLGPTGVLMIEDVKSNPTKTPVYRLKKKLVELLYNIRITEV